MASEEPGTESVQWPQGRQREENLLLLLPGFTQPAQVSAHRAPPSQPAAALLYSPFMAFVSQRPGRKSRRGHCAPGSPPPSCWGSRTGSSVSPWLPESPPKHPLCHIPGPQSLHERSLPSTPPCHTQASRLQSSANSQTLSRQRHVLPAAQSQGQRWEGSSMRRDSPHLASESPEPWNGETILPSPLP